MGFGLKKCGVLLMKRKKKVRSDGIAFLDGRLMREIEEDGLTYLGILEVDMTRGREISETTHAKESWSWLRKADLKIQRETLICEGQKEVLGVQPNKKVFAKYLYQQNTPPGNNRSCNYQIQERSLFFPLLPLPPYPPPLPPPTPLLRSLGSYYDLASSYASIVRMHRTNWTA